MTFTEQEFERMQYLLGKSKHGPLSFEEQDELRNLVTKENPNLRGESLDHLINWGIMYVGFTLITAYGKGWYLFSWDKIPGADSDKLIKFLEEKYDIDWVNRAKIEKIDDGKTIRLSSGEDSVSLRLNDEKTKAYLKIGKFTLNEFIAKMENGKLNIYRGATL